jgi:two-component system chemotaxis response regulator CheB
MAQRDIVVIGASTGGLQALLELLDSLPPGIPAALFVVIHTAPEGSGPLPEILARSGTWAACYAEDGAAVEHGRIYVAPPDRHLLIKRGGIRVTRGPRENRFRPAIDPLFRTAARAFGARVIGIVLSGGLDDGTHGLELIKRHGGLAIAQDPQDAVMPSMPLSAIQNVEVDHILAPAAIAAKLPVLVREPVTDDARVVPEAIDVAEGITDHLRTGQSPGPLSPYTCPECGGALWELEDGRVLRFQCHVGHAFTAGSLAAEQGDSLGHTMWSALRALEEQAALRRRMAEHAEHLGHAVAARQLQHDAKDAERQASTMRQLLLREDVDGKPQPLPAPRHASSKRKGRSKRRTRAG